MSKKDRNRGLGRGLSALMADVDAFQEPNKEGNRAAERILPIEKLEPNPDQPRRSFNQDALTELSASIKEKGIIQPLIVRNSPRIDGNFEIVAGERRWRASQMAQLHEVPVIVRDFNDTEVLEVAIIENIQRADLNAVDEAAGYRQLMDRFGHTQEQLATALGKSRSHIANLMRLLSLPDPVQDLLVEGKLTAGHARTLVGQENAVEIAQKIVSEGLSVRDAEKLAKATQAPKVKTVRGNTTKDADTIQLERELAANLGVKVAINHDAGKESGKLTLSYANLEQLDDILRQLSGG